MVKMIVCSFYGRPTVYDARTYGKILNAVESLVQKNDGVDFWFYWECLELSREKSFLDLCLDAVGEVKARYPEKLICKTRVITDLFKDEIIEKFKQNRVRLRTHIFDRIISPNFDDPDLNYVVDVSNNTMRWVIQQADCVMGFANPECKYSTAITSLIT